MRGKQIILFGLLALIGVTAGAGAGAAYYWHRAMALPAWHQPIEADTALADTLRLGSGDLLQSKLATGNGVRYDGNNRVEIFLTEAELNQLMVETLAKNPEAAGLLQSAQGLNATIEGNRVRGGLVVNPATLPLQKLPSQAQQSVQQALNTIPLLGDRPFYVGIEGSPRIDQGRLVLGDDTRLQVGRINLTVADVARLTGIDAAQLTETINVVLPQTGITLDGLEFINGEAVLRGVVP
jgi:hypothetical protein